MKQRILAFFLLICMLMASVSCTDPKKKNEEATETETTSAGDRLLVGELSQYTVIIPELTSDGEKKAINELIIGIRRDFGVLLSMKDDRTAATEKEILIGATNRQQTETVRKLLRSGETYVGFCDGKLVVLGSTPEDIVKAIGAFAEHLSARAGETVLFDGETDLIYNKGTYELSDLSLNGVSLTEFTILYADANTMREKALAELIQEVIAKRSGIIVPVQSDKESAYGHVLLVGQASDALSANQAALMATEDVVVLLGNVESDLFYATQVLIRRLEASTGDVQISASEVLSYTEADLNLWEYGMTIDRVSIMSYNVQNAGQGVSDIVNKYGKIATMIDFQNPDFVCMQECVGGTGAAEGIRKALTKRDSYRVIQDNRYAQAIIYNADKYTLLESGSVDVGKAGDEEGSLYDRQFLWAKMQSKTSNVSFVVISVHVDYVESAGNAQFSRIISYVKEHFNGMPVMIAGDYNLTKSQPLHANLSANGFEDVGVTALNSKNSSASTFPQNETVIDFIYEYGFSTEYYEVMTQTINPSDHRPIFAECVIDLK